MNARDGFGNRRWDVAAMGETMVAFVPDNGGQRFRRTYVGAESNVAIGVRNAGATSCWVSRVGNDDTGRFLCESISSHGVDLHVHVDEQRPTGLCLKEFRNGQTTVRYYRDGSAASQLTFEDLPALSDISVLHVTGITPALSATAAEAVNKAMQQARLAGTRVSYDLNLRPRLWPDLKTARRALLALAPLADVVFVGADESRAVDAGADGRSFQHAAGLRPDATLVFKHGPAGAEVWAPDADRPVFEPAAQEVNVVDVTGAGDAFVSGFLFAELRGAPARARLRLGHLFASRAVVETGDVGRPLPPHLIDRILHENPGDR